MIDLDSRIRIVASELLGWRYGSPGYPRRLASITQTDSLVDSRRRIDCSSLTAFVLTNAFPFAGWVFDDYRDLQIYDASRPFSPIDAVTRRGIGQAAEAPIAGRWHLCQTWIKLDPLGGGHARLFRAIDSDRMEILESTNLENGIGPRWALSTWAEFAPRYAGIRIAALED